ncbi:hypothetical protein Pcinc_033244 [Petrolisthes cinctipes]|uniref:Uncharacterized protein n=1 Tax=Petrolisthes cinctipes TaxID=88211 RepID=A0AAE1EST0_PETCI|nr:hypothetical protein Pcinc_033244 [Petrolisthes cinctipes]
MSNHPVTLPITELSPPYLCDCPPVTQPASSPALSASVPVCLRIQIYLTYLFTYNLPTYCTGPSTTPASLLPTTCFLSYRFLHTPLDRLSVCSTLTCGYGARIATQLALSELVDPHSSLHN